MDDLAKRLQAMFIKGWTCGVFVSGYHNGARCTPDDPHEGWGCQWTYSARVPARVFERLINKHGGAEATD